MWIGSNWLYDWNMGKIKNFTDLEIYQKSLELTKEIYKITQTFPEAEKFGLLSQLTRSVSSVGANIAEGFGRYYRKEFVRFLYNARGSLTETLHHLIIAFEVGYISQKKLDILEQKLTVLHIKINNLISSLKKKT